MWPVPLLFDSRPPCFGVSLAASYIALVTTGAQKKSVRMRPVITIRLRGVGGDMSPYLRKLFSAVWAPAESGGGRSRRGRDVDGQSWQGCTSKRSEIREFTTKCVHPTRKIMRSTRTIGSAMLGRGERRGLRKTGGRGKGGEICHIPLLPRGKLRLSMDTTDKKDRGTQNRT